MNDKQRILIVDDERNIRTILSQCLELAGYEVASAANGLEALEKLGQDQIDLVLLDMLMPGIDGLETLRRIRALRPKVPVVMITAHGTIDNAVETLKLGAVDFLRKPFTPDQIRDLCQDVLQRRQLESTEGTSAHELVRLAKQAITEKDFASAQQLLHKAIGQDATAPEPFNLLGVMFEMAKQLPEAQRMYRAALALDPSYKPADDNLRRTVQFDYTTEGIRLDDEQRRE